MSLDTKKQLCSWMKRFNTATLDDFKERVQESVSKSYAGHTDQHIKVLRIHSGDPELLMDLEMNVSISFHNTLCVEEMAGEFCMLGLHKQAELHITNVIKMTFPGLFEKFRRDFPAMLSASMNDVHTLPDYKAFNELRLIANSIKHQDSVSGKLAAEFETWVEGAQFSYLFSHYERLKPLVINFIIAFVEQAFSKSTRNFENSTS